MDVMDTNAINELFAPFSTTEFDNQAGMASPSYPQIVMDNTSTENSPGGKDVWDELDAIEPLLLDLPVDTNSPSTYTSQPTMDYDQFFPESLGPKMTAIYEPLYDVNSPQTMKEGSAYSPRQGDELHSHRPQKVGRAKHQSPRVVRTKCPIFPESSTPLSELKSYSSTSLSSASRSSTVKSDGSSYPGTFASDPGQCEASDPGYCTSSEDKTIQQFLKDVLKPRKKLYVADNEDEIEKSASLSPVGRCESPIAAMPPTTTKAALKIEIPVRYVKKITDLDRKILKLQAERAKLLEKGQSKVDYLENSTDNRRGSFETKSSVQIHYYAVGIPELDGACYDEGNLLLSSIGGITNNYRVVINNLYEVCNQKDAGHSITDCLNHMKTLLVGHQTLKLHQMDDGLYQLLVQPDNPEMICQDLAQSMVAANELLKITQQIVGSSAVVETRLKLVIETVIQLVQSCEATCDHLGILDERKIQIKNVLEGNQIALETALRLWPKNCLSAKDTLAAITDSMHPMYNSSPRPY